MVELFEMLFFTPTGIISIIVLTLLFGDFRKVKNGYRHSKYPITSNYNPVKLLDGKKWESFSNLKSKLGKIKNTDFFIGNFRFSTQVIKNSRMPFWWKKWAEKTKIFISQENMRKVTMVFGGMGSGKTVFFLSLLDQIENYENALVHDGDKGELLPKLYNPIRDVIFNNYDERAYIHDALNEDPLIAATFFKILLSAASGKDVSFFSTGAKDHLYNILLYTNAQNFEDKAEKWDFFMQEIETLIVNTLSDQQKSEKDIISTLKQTMKPLDLIYFRIKNGARTFVIDDFLNKNHAAKLFISYESKFQDELKPAASAFIQLFTLIHLSRPKTDKQYLYLIDECSTYIRILNDEETLKSQLEKLRSKGVMFVAGFQGVEEEKKTAKMLDKTAVNKFWFRTDGNDTKDDLIKTGRQITYEYTKYSKSGKTTSSSIERQKEDFIKENDYDDLGNRFESIAKIGDIFTRLYTPITDDEKEKVERAKPFIEFTGRKEFEDGLGIKYNKLQNERWGLNKENAAAEDVGETKPDELNF